MDLRAVSGYVAHALLAGYWLWVLSRTAPELRRGNRDRALRTRVLLVKTAGVVLTALVVGVIHFWATHVWHVLVAVPVAALAGMALRREYRRLVAAPRHRMPLAQRVRRGGHFQVIAQSRGRHPAHRIAGMAPRPATVPVPVSVPVLAPGPGTVPGPRVVPDAVTSPLPPSLPSPLPVGGGGRVVPGPAL